MKSHYCLIIIDDTLIQCNDLLQKNERKIYNGIRMVTIFFFFFVPFERHWRELNWPSFYSILAGGPGNRRKYLIEIFTRVMLSTTKYKRQQATNGKRRIRDIGYLANSSGIHRHVTRISDVITCYQLIAIRTFIYEPERSNGTGVTSTTTAGQWRAVFLLSTVDMLFSNRWERYSVWFIY